MTQILKRLEIIKSSIAIEDEEIIELQIIKLSKLEVDEDVRKILSTLENLDYSTALKYIEGYLHRFSGVVEYIDTEVQGLKLELKSLESKLQERIEEKTEYLNDIEDFNTQYSLHIGELIKTILELKKEILYKQTIKQQKQKVKYLEEVQTFEETKETIDEIKNTINELEEALENMDEDDENYEEISQAYQELQDELEKLEDALEEQEIELEKTKEFIEDEEIEEEYEEVKSQYEEYNNEYNHIKDEYNSKIQINDEEKKELKKLYKKAARLCHPDIVADELKEKAHDIMQQLNDAYSKQDLSVVKKIFNSLTNGTIFELTSDKIEDKELLKEKIEEYKQSIIDIESEIEDIKNDETYQTISGLEDWDEYFEELKSDLEEEKERLEKEAREVLEQKEEEAPEWMQKLWNWAEDNNIPYNKLSRKKDSLLTMKILDLTNVELNYLPNEIINLVNLQEIILWGCDLKYLPRDIIKLENLKKLNLRGNPDLAVSPTQLEWINNLSKRSILFKDNIRSVREETVDMFAEQPSSSKEHSISKDIPSKQETIQKEQSDYSKHIKNIENPNFEKIRRYCNNLVNDNQSDSMQEYLAKNGKMYKATIYDALEQFIEKLDGKAITVIDWASNQGIASMLVLDYIKEKQLDIKVSKLILLDDDKKLLKRALVNANALAQDKVKLKAYNITDNYIKNVLEKIKDNTTLNLFCNDKIVIDINKINIKSLVNAYFMCTSNQNDEIINKIYHDIELCTDVQNLSIRECKIGRFKKFEKNFRIKN